MKKKKKIEMKTEEEKDTETTTNIKIVRREQFVTVNYIFKHKYLLKTRIHAYTHTPFHRKTRQPTQFSFSN